MPQTLEKTLWLAADKLRNNIDAADYKHIVLSLVFLKYLSDRYGKGDSGRGSTGNGAVRQEPSQIHVPSKARWESLQINSTDPAIGKIVDNAMAAIEATNSDLKGLLGNNYDRPGLDKRRLGELIDLIGKLSFSSPDGRSPDVLSRVYEYLLSKFARAEGRRAGQYYTPPCVGRLLVEMLEPFTGRIYDPCCGMGGIFIQIRDFVQARNGCLRDVGFYGQESNRTSWQLAKLNLAVHGLTGDLGSDNADTLRSDLHEGLEADYILANPPFNDSDWAGDSEEENDIDWIFGTPPRANANFAWVQHIICHLAHNGFAGIVLTKGSLSNSRSGEGDIRRKIIEADLIDCIVAMPGKLFYSTDIPVCFWVLARDKSGMGFRDRRGQTLFIDASRLGVPTDRAHNEVPEEELLRVARTYHAWRGTRETHEYRDVSGFSKTATLSLIAANGHILTPGIYVGVPKNEQDFDFSGQTLEQLLGTLQTQFTEGKRLQRLIKKKLRKFGYVD